MLATRGLGRTGSARSLVASAGLGRFTTINITDPGSGRLNTAQKAHRRAMKEDQEILDILGAVITTRLM